LGEPGERLGDYNGKGKNQEVKRNEDNFVVHLEKGCVG